MARETASFLVEKGYTPYNDRDDNERLSVAEAAEWLVPAVVWQHKDALDLFL